MRKSNTPFSTKLPAKGAMAVLDKSRRTINDYAKATPVNDVTAQSPMTKLLKRPR